ncbi:MAG: hypothetical protein JWO68_4286, partial [Actinomycetia bacterium]|nr:hypothetical protein [Actinomycetes bacterium]
MKSISIGSSKLVSSRLAYGCWRIAGTWEPSEVTSDSVKSGIKAVLSAYEAGYTLFDHADIYCHGVAEDVFGKALKQTSGMREKILIATKCGIRFPGEPWSDSPQRYDFSKQHIIDSCEGSLKRLGIETIDLYQLHRPDFLADPDEVAAAFTELRDSGKVREFGVSNFRPSLLSALQKACPMALVVNQIEISLARLAPFEDGTLDQCLENKMTPLAWSPLGGGVLGLHENNAPPGHKHHVSLNLQETIQAISEARGT